LSLVEIPSGFFTTGPAVEMRTYRATCDFDYTFQATSEEEAREIGQQIFEDWLRDGYDSLIISEADPLEAREG
jgi:hypothetical protein